MGPHPGESEKAFVARMRTAYREHRDKYEELGLVHTKRKLTRDAQITARFQVGRESIIEIASTLDVDDRRTIPKAIEAFATLIELPLREKPSLPSGISKYL